jgi:hypothetical protein
MISENREHCTPFCRLPIRVKKELSAIVAANGSYESRTPPAKPRPRALSWPMATARFARVSSPILFMSVPHAFGRTAKQTDLVNGRARKEDAWRSRPFGSSVWQDRANERAKAERVATVWDRPYSLPRGASCSVARIRDSTRPQTEGSDSISMCDFMNVRANQEYPSRLTGRSLYSNW